MENNQRNNMRTFPRPKGHKYPNRNGLLVTQLNEGKETQQQTNQKYPYIFFIKSRMRKIS